MTYCASKDKMLITFVDAMDTRARLLCAGHEQTGTCPEVLSEAKALIAKLRNSEPAHFSETEAWAEAYRLESLIALAEPADNLLPEARLRLDELVLEQSSAAPRLKAALVLAEGQKQESQLRSLLLSIINEIHWTKQRKFFSRPIKKSATRRIVWAGLVSFVLFLLPCLFLYAMPYLARERVRWQI